MTESFPASVDSTEKCPTKRGPWMWLLLVMLFIASSLMARGMRLSARSSPGCGRRFICARTSLTSRNHLSLFVAKAASCQRGRRGPWARGARRLTR